MATTRKPAASSRKPATSSSRSRSSATGRFAKAAPSEPACTCGPGDACNLASCGGTPPTSAPPVSEEERQGLLQAYSALKGAGLPVPPEIATPVESWIAQEQARREAEAAQQATYQQQVDEENAAGPWYVRNGYRSEFNLRLDRQTEKRRIQLKPRGVPGDLHPLEDGDLKDPILVRNLHLGLIEIIPSGEATRIMDQQTHNMGPRVHTPTAILRNEKGEQYAPDAVKTEIEFGAQGITVATLDPAQMQGHVSDKAVAGKGSFGGLTRGGQMPERVSEFIPTGGNPAIISQAPLGGLGDNAQAKIADDLARRKGVGGPSAGLGGLQVTVAPPVKN